MLFSIITVTRNNLEGLKHTHACLKAQTCGAYEWIVIDGASDDGTPDYLEKTPARWISEPDEGIYDAMNKGIESATGEYLLFLNAGDALAAPEILEQVAAYLEEAANHPAMLYGDALEEATGNDAPALKPARAHSKAVWGLFTHHQAILYRRGSIGVLRYDTRYKIAADYDFTLRFLDQNRQDAVSLPLTVCLFEAGGISQKQTRLGRREQALIRRRVLCTPALLNAAIVSKQIIAQSLKDYVPTVYWCFKSKR